MINIDNISKYIKPLLPIPTGIKPRGAVQHPICCLLFDIYGTLFISSSGDISITREKREKNSELKHLLAKFAIHENPQALSKRLYDTIENAHGELKARGVDYPEIEIDRIWMEVLDLNDPDRARAFAVEYELIVNPVFPMPHLNDLLSHFKNKRILMGILSNAQFFTPYLFEWFLEADAEELGFHQELIFYSYRVGYAKPSVHLFEKAAEKLDLMNISTASVLYLGNDMKNDICPAKQCGFQTALFAGDERSLRLRADDPMCRDIQADLIITDLIQLTDYI